MFVVVEGGMERPSVVEREKVADKKGQARQVKRRSRGE